MILRIRSVDPSGECIPMPFPVWVRHDGKRSAMPSGVGRPGKALHDNRITGHNGKPFSMIDVVRCTSAIRSSGTIPLVWVHPAESVSMKERFETRTFLRTFSTCSNVGASQAEAGMHLSKSLYALAHEPDDRSHRSLSTHRFYTKRQSKGGYRMRRAVSLPKKDGSDGSIRKRSFGRP